MVQYIEISDSDSDDESPPFNLVKADPPRQDTRHFGATQDGPLFGRDRITEPVLWDDAVIIPRPGSMLEPLNSRPSSPLPRSRADWKENQEDSMRTWMEGNAANQRIGQLGGPSALGQQIEVADSLRETGASEVECIDRVLAIFADVSVDYVSSLYNQISKSPDDLVEHILDQMDKGVSYPRAEDPKKQLKRKRVVDETEEAIRKYDNADRLVSPAAHTVRQETRKILSSEFTDVPMSFIDTMLNSSGYRLFSAYLKLEAAQRTLDPKNPAYHKNKSRRKTIQEYQAVNLDLTINDVQTQTPEKAEVLRELQAARKHRLTADMRRQAEREKELSEEENERKAIAEGTMAECGCCFSDYPLNRMVHCNSEKVLHWFCRSCARQMASTAIGNSKYQLQCMSTEGCEAGFSMSQRSQFLDESAISALERNEAKAMLLMAAIENLATCPFCQYAAEYPPVEENREFYCLAPDCGKVSCRMCDSESHIPKSCDEHAKDNGLSALRFLEEAMSTALIRKCNKCEAPFVKEDGCNKMTCSRCRNIQCYVCSLSLPLHSAYGHFDEKARGGKEGNCPLFENLEERHKTDVGKAEREALEKIRAEHPEVSEEQLKVTDNVTRRNPRDALQHPPEAPLHVPAPPHPRLRLNFEQPNRYEEFRRRQNMNPLLLAANPPANPLAYLPAHLPINNPPRINNMEQFLENMAGGPRVPAFGPFMAMAQPNVVYPVEMEGVEYGNFREPAVPRQAPDPEAGLFGPPPPPPMIRMPPRHRRPNLVPTFEETAWDLYVLRQQARNLQPNGFAQAARDLDVRRQRRELPSPLDPLAGLPGMQIAGGAKRQRNMRPFPAQFKNDPV